MNEPIEWANVITWHVCDPLLRDLTAGSNKQLTGKRTATENLGRQWGKGSSLPSKQRTRWTTVSKRKVNDCRIGFKALPDQYMLYDICQSRCHRCCVKHNTSFAYHKSQSEAACHRWLAQWLAFTVAVLQELCEKKKKKKTPEPTWTATRTIGYWHFVWLVDEAFCKYQTTVIDMLHFSLCSL